MVVPEALDAEVEVPAKGWLPLGTVSPCSWHPCKADGNLTSLIRRGRLLGSQLQRGCLRKRRPADKSKSCRSTLSHCTQRSGLQYAGTGMSKTFKVLRPEGLLAGFYLREDNRVEASSSPIDIVSGLLSKEDMLGDMCWGKSLRRRNSRLLVEEQP
jgi:hypothetical protein